MLGLMKKGNDDANFLSRAKCLFPSVLFSMTPFLGTLDSADAAVEATEAMRAPEMNLGSFTFVCVDLRGTRRRLAFFIKPMTFFVFLLVRQFYPKQRPRLVHSLYRRHDIDCPANGDATAFQCAYGVARGTSNHP
jgi:hypothetical protein